MGSRSGTGFRSLVGYRDGRLINKYAKRTSQFLSANKPKDVVSQTIGMISMSLPASEQLYAAYLAYLMSGAVYETYKKRDEKDLIGKIEDLGRESLFFVVGSYVSELVDNTIADFIRREDSPLNQNQINLTKTVVKTVLTKRIIREIEKVI